MSYFLWKYYTIEPEYLLRYAQSLKAVGNEEKATTVLRQIS